MKAFHDFPHFLKTYFALKRQVDPDKVAETLGRPTTLDLSDEQAEQVQELFCVEGRDPAGVARWFFDRWPRTDFRYFMALSSDGLALEFTNADLALDGVELIQSAMIKLGAIKKHDDDGEWYYQTAHPMVKRLADCAQSQPEPKSKQHGLLA